MLLGLSKIIETPDSELPFRTELDLHDLQFGGSYPVQEPVRAEGSVRNVAGVLVLQATVSTTLHATCDRCAAAFDRDIRFPLDVVLVTEMANEENEDEWVFPLEGDSADLDDIVRTVFVLSLDSKLLCREDCKGICQCCGKNLNDGPCNCQKELDPRFAALKQLLEK